MSRLLEPFLSAPSGQGGTLRETPGTELLPALARYLDLLLVWSARTNLTAIREPEEIVRRHFGESLFAARCLAPHLKVGQEVLDLGSGAGFPGLPLALLLPELRVTLAESQGKKAAFLREAVRSTGISATVFGARSESFSSERQFDAVTLRAVDNSALALAEAKRLVRPQGWLMQFLTEEPESGEASEVYPIPGGVHGAVCLSRSDTT